MYCSKCGKENTEDARFCAACGSEMASERNSTSAPPAVTTSPADGPPPRPAPRGRSWIWPVSAVAIVIVALAIALPLLLLRGDPKAVILTDQVGSGTTTTLGTTTSSSMAPTTASTVATTTSLAPTTTTTAAPTTTTSAVDPALLAYQQALQPIMTEASGFMSQLQQAVNGGLENLDPAAVQAAQQAGEGIRNALPQLEAIVPPDAYATAHQKILQGFSNLVNVTDLIDGYIKYQNPDLLTEAGRQLEDGGQVLSEAFSILNRTSIATIGGAVLAKDVKGDNFDPVEPTSTFRSNQAVIHLVVSVENVSPGTTVKAVWTAVDVGDQAPANTKIDEAETTIDHSGNVHFTLSIPSSGVWPAGDYQVDIYLEGQGAKTLFYEITQA